MSEVERGAGGQRRFGQIPKFDRFLVLKPPLSPWSIHTFLQAGNEIHCPLLSLVQCSQGQLVLECNKINVKSNFKCNLVKHKGRENAS